MVATVSAEVKIASVNMEDLQLMFYKRVDADARLQKEREGILEEINKRGEKVKALAQQLEDLQKQSDPTLSEQAIKKIREKMVSIKNEYDAERQEFETFVKRRQLAFGAIQQREGTLILQEIRKVIGEVAEAEGVDLVLDASPRTQLILPYVKSSMNITERVAAKLNADAPEGYDAQEELRKVRGAAENVEGVIPAEAPAAAPAGGETSVTPEVAK